MLGGYEVMAAAIGGLLVGAICMLWVLTRSDSMYTTGVFDKLFSLLSALLLIRSENLGAKSVRARLLTKVRRKQKAHLKQKVQRLHARLRFLEGLE